MFKIRQAEPSDLQLLTTLLSSSDTQLPVVDLETLLDREKCITWVAVSGDKIVGTSCALIRTLRYPQGEARVGYWSNLYIHPDYRGQLLYPMLPMRMFRSLEKNGVEFLYAAIRRPKVTEAHLKIGLRKIGHWPVMIKPVRPCSLVARHKGWPGVVRTLLKPVDGIAAVGAAGYRQAWRIMNRTSARIAKPDSNQLADLLSEPAETIQQVWSPEIIQERYLGNTDIAYEFYGSFDEDQLHAAIITRRVVRDNGLVVCVIMEARARSGEEKRVRGLLIEAEADAYKNGCDAMMMLGAHEASTATVVRQLGYISSSEQYTLMVWPKKMKSESSWIQEFDHWCFGFGDHDAF
jgi:N-acetylglutamate synthase-like GNAT family acetyltransferase